MQTEFVIAKCDVHCNWTGPYPAYRLYVNDELFAERTWIWQDTYLEENLQIQARPGKYPVRIETLNPEFAKIKIKNLRIDSGPAIIANDGSIQIYTPERPNENT